MAWLLTTIHVSHRGEDENYFGESLNRPFDGVEIGFLRQMADIWAAVATAEMRDWLVGVHYPLFLPEPPVVHLPFTSADPEQRREAYTRAEQAARDARAVGARYILFHLPSPAVTRPGLDLSLWAHLVPPERLEPATEGALREAFRAALSALLEVQEQVGIEVVLELDGPHPLVYESDLLGELMPEFPNLSLCLDTSRLNLLARTHGQDPAALAERWLPWTRHLHLSEARVAPGRVEQHVPAHPDMSPAEGWTGAAVIGARVVAAHPRCRIVLEHDPRKLDAVRLEEAHRWARRLAGR